MTQSPCRLIKKDIADLCIVMGNEAGTRNVAGCLVNRYRRGPGEDAD